MVIYIKHLLNTGEIFGLFSILMEKRQYWDFYWW